MSQILLEIKAGEGGDDSKLFAQDMYQMYLSYCNRLGAVAECL